MINTDSNGNLVFEINDGRVKEHFTFYKDNYDSHCLKHNISDKESKGYIDQTFEDPDCITTGCKNGQKNYYKVVNCQKSKKSIAVRVYKAICFKDKKKGGKAFYAIATVIDFWSSNYRVINGLETEIWKKTESLL